MIKLENRSGECILNFENEGDHTEWIRLLYETVNETQSYSSVARKEASLSHSNQQFLHIFFTISSISLTLTNVEGREMTKIIFKGLNADTNSDHLI